MDTTDSNFTPNGENYFFIACLDFDLNVLWERKFGGDTFYSVYSVCSTPENECVIAATRDTIVDSKNINETYILKVDENGNIVTSIPVAELAYNVVVYPNPGNSNNMLPENQNTVKLNLYTIAGEKVLAKEFQGTKVSIQTGPIPAGIYIYELHNSKKLLSSGRWIKE